MTRRILVSCAILLFAATAALAQGTVPMPGAADPRIRTVVYNPYEVVWLRGHLGYQMMVEFHPAERIENVSIGDSTSWQVTPNRKATLLFLKPTSRDATTNMTVITNLRRYSFQLTATDRSGTEDPNIIFGVRFLYAEEPRVVEIAPPPPPPAPAEPPVENLNFAYEITGSKRIAPLSVFDDTTTTFFQFPDQIETPAIFALDAAGTENLVNFRVRGRHFVVDAVAQSFVLRLGRERTLVRNRVFGAARPPAQESRTAPAAPSPTSSSIVVPAPTMPPTASSGSPVVSAGSPPASAVLSDEGADLSAPDLATIREITQYARANSTLPVTAPPTQAAVPAVSLRTSNDLAAPPPAPLPAIQVGAFSTKEKAESVAATLREFRANVSTVAVNGFSLYRVRLGPWTSVAEAESLLGRVHALGFGEARLVSEPGNSEPAYVPTGFTNWKETDDYTSQRAATVPDGAPRAQAAESRP